MAEITILGGGLAGCEAALWLAGQGVPVTLVEQKPLRRSPAHGADTLAELVCSNSLKAMRVESAAGLLKEEMRRMGSSLLGVADECRVAAGGALAVDRGRFTAGVTRLVEENQNIELVHREAVALPEDGMAMVATGPLTDGALAESIAGCVGGKMLSFYDAAAPIVTADSLDMGEIFAASRYGRGDEDYLNCPFDKAGYEAFYAALVEAESAPLHEFDRAAGEDGGGESEAPTVYEGCMPIEVMAKRGAETMRYGPLRPVGLRDPRTGHRPWANVQLRRENAEGTLYNLVGFQTNLRFGEQERVFRLVPGLAKAEFARYGVMHRNTFLNSPAVLEKDLALKGRPGLFFAGQITGFEGYMESAASGLLAARAALARMRGDEYEQPPAETMCGALARYVTAENKDFQPMGANMGILPPLGEVIKGKQERYAALAARALGAQAKWLEQQ